MNKILKEYFGYDDFRPLQEEIINNTLAGNDSFVLMPTGGGKSLCFQVPALILPGLTVVISPLIALMKDQVDSLKTCGVTAEFINSSLSQIQIGEICQRLKRGEIKILYIAPERFAIREFQEFLKSLEISQIAVDEAHCISEWGHDFRPDYKNLSQLKDVFPETPIIALTATATDKVKEDIVKQLRINNAKTFVASFDRENLEVSVLEKKNALEKIIGLLDEHKNESVIIYCLSRKETEALAENLRLNKFNAKCYHAGLSIEKRKKTQEDFIKDKVDIITATIAFGMGIDKPDVRLVIHHSFPKTLEGYYQEIGRAGRDGLPSKCVMLYSYGDTRKHNFFINQIADADLKGKAEKKLNDVLSYCELITCRKKFVLNYFGEDFQKDNCKACDVCLTEKEMFDATVIAQKVISTILRLNLSYGANYIVQILLGKKIQKIRQNGHDKLSVFGIVDEFSENDMFHIVNHMIASGLIIKDTGAYPTLTVSSEGMKFINERNSLELVKPAKKESKKKEEIKDFDAELFDKLKELRREIADSENIPPFMVFGDKSLQEMARHFPSNKDDFLRISGVGATKLEVFGDAFLDTIIVHCELNDIKPEPFAFNKKGVRAIRKKTPNQKTYQKTKNALLQKKTIKQMAKSQKKSVITIIKHIEKLAEVGDEIDIEYLKSPKKKFEEMCDCFEECGDERLKPVFEALDGNYSYDKLRLVRALRKLEK